MEYLELHRIVGNWELPGLTNNVFHSAICARMSIDVFSLKGMTRVIDHLRAFPDVNEEGDLWLMLNELGELRNELITWDDTSLAMKRLLECIDQILMLDQYAYRYTVIFHLR